MRELEHWIVHIKVLFINKSMRDGSMQFSSVITQRYSGIHFRYQPHLLLVGYFILRLCKSFLGVRIDNLRWIVPIQGLYVIVIEKNLGCTPL